MSFSLLLKFVAMKNLFTLIVVVATITACLGSCSGGPSDAKEATDTIPTFVKADTMEVLDLVEQYLDYVKNNEYDAALAMLNVIENDSVKPLDEKMKASIRMQQQVFPVLDYQVEEMEFVHEHSVRVTYAIEFLKKEPGSNIPNMMRLSFAPQRINATWYLELLDR